MAEADEALQRLRERWSHDDTVDFVLTNLGVGGWTVILTCRHAFEGDTPDAAVDRALAAYWIHA
jgi:hypothetical protein